MHWRRLLRLTRAAALAGFVSSSLAAAPGAAAAEKLEPRAWLQRIQEAVSLGNYTGTLVASVAGEVSSSRIAHYCDGVQQFERIELLDGQARQVYRHDDKVLTLWPSQRVALFEQRGSLGAVPSLFRARPDERVFERYTLRTDGSDRVAGHEARVYVLQPRDDLRFAQRLWTDKRTGLLLRTDLLAADGRVLESAAFSDVTIGVRPQPDSVLRAMKRLDGYRVLRPTVVAVDLEADGWRLPQVPGFERVSSLRRTVDGVADSNGDHEPVLQVVFSDGLTHVSMFIEPYREGRHRSGTAAIGATHTLMKRHEQWWVTVMGDVPMATVQQFAVGLERRR
jgi:sigma-E factor negative regulatory protein RseB